MTYTGRPRTRRYIRPQVEFLHPRVPEPQEGRTVDLIAYWQKHCAPYLRPSSAVASVAPPWWSTPSSWP